MQRYYAKSALIVLLAFTATSAVAREPAITAFNAACFNKGYSEHRIAKTMEAAIGAPLSFTLTFWDKTLTPAPDAPDLYERRCKVSFAGDHTKDAIQALREQMATPLVFGTKIALPSTHQVQDGTALIEAPELLVGRIAVVEVGTQKTGADLETYMIVDRLPADWRERIGGSGLNEFKFESLQYLRIETVTNGIGPSKMKFQPRSLSVLTLAAFGLAACSSGTQTTGPQFHPGDLVRQQNAAASGTAVQSPTNAVVAMRSGVSNPSVALAAFDQFCVQNANSLMSAGGKLQTAGYTLWQTVETNAVNKTEIAQIYRKSGVAHAVYLQTFSGAPAPYLRGVDAPDTSAHRQAIAAKMASAARKPQAANAVGADNVWDVNGTAHVSAVSVAPKYEWGATRSFALVPRRN